MSDDVSLKKGGVTRRGFLTVAVSAIVAGVVAGVGAYFAAPVKEVTKTLERTVTTTMTLAPGAPVTTTVTVTAPPTTVTTTVRETVTTTVTATPPPPKPLLEGYELRIGIALPLSGAQAAFGQSGYRGALLATDEINEAGGILGAKIKLIVEDTAGDPKIAVSAVEKLITVNKVHVVRGVFSSTASYAVGPICEKYKTPRLTIGNSARELVQQGWKYHFKMPPGSDDFAKVSVEFMREMLEPMLKLGRPLRIVILHDQALYGVSDKEEFLKIVKEKNLDWEILAIESYPSGALDFKPILEKLKALNPDVCSLSSYLLDTVLIAKQAKEIGFNPIWVSVGGAGVQSPVLIEMAGENVAYWFASNEYWYDRNYPSAEAGRRVTQAFLNRYGYPLDFQAWSGYAGMYILKQLIEKAAEENPDKVKELFAKDDVAAIRELIRDGLATMKFYLDWTGDLRFRPDGQLVFSIHGPEMGVTIIQVQPSKPGDLWSAHGYTYRTVYSPVFKVADPILPPK